MSITQRSERPPSKSWLRILGGRASARASSWLASWRLRSTITRLEGLVRSCPVPMLELDQRGKVVFFNPAAERIVDAIDATRARTELQNELSDIVARCLRSEAPDHGLETQVDGRILIWSFIPVPRAGVVRAYPVDLSELRELQEKLRHSQRMEAVGRMSCSIAHDFNNILTVVLGHSDFALRALTLPGGDGAEAREALAQINKAAQRGAALTRGLLSFGRGRSGQQELLDLNEAVRESAQMLRRLLPANVDLLTVEEPALGLARAARGEMDQVILNLVLNARDAMPRGGRITMETSNREVARESRPRHIGLPEGRYVALSVADTGSGIREEIMSRLFRPFVTGKQDGKGTGLGLASVRDIVRQNGGDVRVCSSPGDGASFTVYLPRAGEEAGPSRATKVRGEPPGGEPPGGRETILLAVHEEPTRTILRRSLASKGYRILETGRGEEALVLASQRRGAIDLLLSDLVIADLTGQELASRLREIQPGARIILMSGYEDWSLREQLGATLLEKAFTPHDLIWKVRDVLDGRTRIEGSEEAT